MKTFIFLNGGRSEGSFYKTHYLGAKGDGDIVICADGGFTLARSLGVLPDLVVGDLDSVGSDIPEGVEVVRYPSEKDFSDFELALDRALLMVPERIFVYGALGGRLDHEVVNLVILAHLSVSASFVEQDVEAHNAAGTLVLEGLGGRLCSLIAIGGPCRVECTEGLRYPLRSEELKPSGRGLSNIITGDRASIRVLRGKLLVIVVKSGGR